MQSLLRLDPERLGHFRSVYEGKTKWDPRDPRAANGIPDIRQEAVAVEDLQDPGLQQLLHALGARILWNDYRSSGRAHLAFRSLAPAGEAFEVGGDLRGRGGDEAEHQRADAREDDDQVGEGHGSWVPSGLSAPPTALRAGGSVAGGGGG